MFVLAHYKRPWHNFYSGMLACRENNLVLQHGHPILFQNVSRRMPYSFIDKNRATPHSEAGLQELA
jgi:hypothetical protein